MKQVTTNDRARATAMLAALLASGCDNQVARNMENLFVQFGLDREIAQWIPPIVGVVGGYLAFRFMLSDTRKY